MTQIQWLYGTLDRLDRPILGPVSSINVSITISWRGSNENTNGLLRHYLPKGTDLSGLTQEELDAIAWKLNTRPRKLHSFRSPIEVYDEHLAKARTRPDL